MEKEVFRLGGGGGGSILWNDTVKRFDNAFAKNSQSMNLKYATGINWRK
jgi:hypothetical protein